MKEKKKVNGWKLTAIISLIINGIVALLLTIGLATPRSMTKVSAVNNNSYTLYSIRYGDASERNTYMRSTEFLTDMRYLYQYNPTELSMYEDSTFVGFSFYSNLSLLSFELLEGDLSPQFVYTYFEVGFDKPSNLVRYISLNGPSSAFTLYDFEHYDITTYYWNSSIHFLQVYDAPTSFHQMLYKITQYLGTNDVYRSYSADDHFNPNLYIGLNTQSGYNYLYNSPHESITIAYDNEFNNRFPPSWWIPPTFYDGDGSAFSYYTTLGFFEIPLMFESNGELFCGIRLYYDVVTSYALSDGTSETFVYNYSQNAIDGVLDHRYYYHFVGMSYCYELTSALWLDDVHPTAKYSLKEKMVCSLPIYDIYRNEISNDIQKRIFVYYIDKPLNWMSDAYKTINLCSFSETQAETQYVLRESLDTNRFAINYLTKAEVLGFDMSSTIPIIPGGNTGNIGNVFVLIGDGFKSITSLLSVAILPGISIGMLMFLPLVLTIIIVIIKLVKR